MKSNYYLALLAGSLVVSFPVDAIAQQSTAAPEKIAEQDVPAFLEGQLQVNERRFWPAILRTIEEPEPNRAIKMLDDLIPKLDTNSLIRLQLRTYKARQMVASGRIEEGEAAFRNLMEEYPGIIHIRLQAIDTLGYTPAADTSARLWIETAASNPEAARALDGYTLGALAENLEANEQLDLRNALFLALDNIGYDPGSASLRDDMQFAIFYNAAADTGREDEARVALAKITNTKRLINIAAQRKFQAYWSDIDIEAASLESKTEALLNAMKNDFLAAGNGSAASEFLSKSVSFTDPRAVANAYTPILERIIKQGERSPYDMYNAMFWVAPLAAAWTKTGSPTRARSLYETALQGFGNSRGLFRLNVSGNYAVHLLEHGRPKEALAYIEPAIADLQTAGVALSALAPMHAVRIRAHHQLGQPEQAVASRQYLEADISGLLGTYSDTVLAIGDEAAARDAILSVLRSADPGAAISYLQLPLQQITGPDRIAVETAKERLREDPDIASALAKVGRVVKVSPVSFPSFDHADVARTLAERMH